MFFPILCFLLPCSERSFDKIFPDTYRERDIIFRKESVAPRKKETWNTNCSQSLFPETRFSVILTISNFIFRQSSSALLHRNIFPRRTRLYWKLPEAVATVLPELRKRDRFGEKLEDSWNAEACSNTEKLKNLCDTYRLA